MRLDIYLHFAGFGFDLGKAISKLFDQGEKIMASVQELNDKIDQLSAATDAERQEVLAVLQALKDQVQALKDQIAAGTPASQADLDALATRLDDQIAKVQAIVTDADKT